MRKSAVVLLFLVAVASLQAQSESPARSILVQDLSITGATHISPTDREALEAELKQRCCVYFETQEIREQIVYAFQERGYYKAHINRLEVAPLNLDTAPPAVSILVDLSDGQQFRLNSIKFRGNEALPADLLRQQFLIHDLAVFNVEKVRQGLQNLRKLYASDGYINFSPVPNTEADDAFAMVTLTIDVDEGKQFYLAGLLLDGEEPHPGDGAKLLEAWKSMEGEVYNGSKIDEWWQLAATMLPPSSRMEQLLELRQDAASHVVTALLNFPNAR